jgi:hypothetical protein
MGHKQIHLDSSQKNWQSRSSFIMIQGEFYERTRSVIGFNTYSSSWIY